MMWGLDVARCDVVEAEWRRAQKRAIKLVESVKDVAFVIRPADTLCRDGRCTAYRDGIIIYSDEAHLSVEGSRWLGKTQNWGAALRAAQ
jgi:hypothetical protein